MNLLRELHNQFCSITFKYLFLYLFVLQPFDIWRLGKTETSSNTFTVKSTKYLRNQQKTITLHLSYYFTIINDFLDSVFLYYANRENIHHTKTKFKGIKLTRVYLKSRIQCTIRKKLGPPVFMNPGPRNSVKLRSPVFSSRAAILLLTLFVIF